VSKITEIQLDDGISFTIKDVETITDEMEYPGIRFHLGAVFEKMVTPIKIDVSTGDVITPRAIEYKYKLKYMALIRHDEQNGTAYAATLASYLACNQDSLVTAETIHVHRNTIIYRIKRLEDTFFFNQTESLIPLGTKT